MFKTEVFEVKNINKTNDGKEKKRKEQSTTTNNTGSETKQSISNNRDKKVLVKPPTPKHSKNASVEERLC
ncbi:unnamed protein product [Diabrotica balteata]|uniref:Uncharacterized protein n=1 Tax=Diabrotica balteata TaxID=107213 RepID=A0A9N9T4J3_DIABA|nr:unnamed protein product [Diabrotica balteata]